MQCATRATCKACSGPLWIDATNVPRCRWCNLQNLDFECRECRSTNLRQGLGGSTRTAAEFGKSFPGVAIVESAGDKIRSTVPPKKQIVIATPGAEPHVDGGYAAVVILDAWVPLHIDSLRATERAVARFCTAISLLAVDGRCVIAGVPASLGQDLALFNLEKIAREELESRRELAFPPHVRLASLQGEVEQTRKLADAVRQQLPRVEVLGPIQLRRGGEIENRFILKFAYADGNDLAKALRAEIMALSAGMSVATSGRNQRAIRVRMDDAEVI
jgi:primosomal protein N' (replication factor Y)